jgi:uncharacterized membrane protein
VIAWATWRYASLHHRLIDPGLSDRVIRHHLRMALVAVAVFAVGVIVSAFGRTAATMGVLLSFVSLLAFLVLSVRDWWEPR